MSTAVLDSVRQCAAVRIQSGRTKTPLHPPQLPGLRSIMYDTSQLGAVTTLPPVMAPAGRGATPANSVPIVSATRMLVTNGRLYFRREWLAQWAFQRLRLLVGYLTKAGRATHGPCPGCIGTPPRFLRRRRPWSRSW